MDKNIIKEILKKHNIHGNESEKICNELINYKQGFNNVSDTITNVLGFNNIMVNNIQQIPYNGNISCNEYIFENDFERNWFWDEFKRLFKKFIDNNVSNERLIEEYEDVEPFYISIGNQRRTGFYLYEYEKFFYTCVHHDPEIDKVDNCFDVFSNSKKKFDKQAINCEVLYCEKTFLKNEIISDKVVICGNCNKTMCKQHLIENSSSKCYFCEKELFLEDKIKNNATKA